MGAAPASKQTIIDLLVLVFSRSEVRDLVGTDALRSVLAIRYQEMVRRDELLLEPLWALLSDQPNFDPAAATPALCRFKTWESHIGLQVVLPAALGDIDSTTLEEWANDVVIPAAELKSIIQPGQASADNSRKNRSTASKARQAQSTVSILQEASDQQYSDRGKRAKGSRTARIAGWEIPLAIVAVLTLGFAGYTIYGFTAGADYTEYRDDAFLQIPVKDVQKLGDQVGAVLADEAWLKTPREEREAQLTAVLESLSGDAVQVVYVMNDKRVVYATAAYKSNGEIRFEFTR